MRVTDFVPLKVCLITILAIYLCLSITIYSLKSLFLNLKKTKTDPEVIKLGHEILNALKYKNIKKCGFLGSDKPKMLFPRS